MSSNQRNGLSCSEAGILGYLASKETMDANKRNRIDEYNKNPKVCAYAECQKALPYEKRFNKYCNHSCSASESNKGCRKHGNPPAKCFNCGAQLKTSNGKYCNNSCQNECKYNEWKRLAEETGIIKGTRAKRYLIETRGHKCEICGITEWMGEPVPLIKDHIDGHSEDDSITNLRLVCGNCDMQLPTYKSKNTGNGRAYRRQRYAEGKSY